MVMVLTLLEKEQLIDNVWAFRFKPAEPLSFIAGQYIHVDLPHANPDAEGTERWFTNSAAPYEGIIQITTRVTDTTFKQALSKLEPGATLNMLEDPEGDFIWQDSELPVVYVAGGIGVTPFRSILKQRAHDGQPLNLTFVYNGRSADVPFKDELDVWSKADPSLKVQYAFGTRLSAESLAKLVPNINTSMVFLSGPEPMVESLGDDLKAHGLPEAQLKQDFFPNYTEANY
jgi:ferredoxin-NADP reductase